MAEGSQWEDIALLVRRARRGDAAAFRELVDLHRGAVVSTLFACGVRCPETARDLAQDVALRAWQRLGTIEDPRAFPAWLRRVAANAARDHLRRLAVRREEDLGQALELEGHDDPQQRSERLAELRLMLAALAREDAEAVRLLVARAEGASVDSLATDLGISPDALKMRVLRIRKRLRARLDSLRRGNAQ
ncbi:MAG: sigma-70 family RNA polymerase sigma factor [Thermoanaerobaculales bacterium]|nr:sigma-70 family RNA polymerase sigma factor [Thermoanaerobaculales bacterium]